MIFNKLTPEEESVIVQKNTEPPFTGEYDQLFDDGVYLCRRCNTPLYRSDDKFDAHCGWPSFDDEIPGAVRRQLDVDGVRIEIVCATCDAHLGHVFLGEKLTQSDTRHCVNSLSMKFVTENQIIKPELAYLGDGCFWSIETLFKRIRGVNSITPGYTGGHQANPTYEEVVSGQTGHAEAVKIEFDPTVISYPALLEIFFGIHDPTAPNQQGFDIGNQYRSVILYTSDNQKLAAEKIMARLTTEKVFEDPIVTELKPFTDFYPAEDYHQDYFKNNQGQPYCTLIIGPKLKKFETKFADWIK
jgi:peptide methionine sulfoxide reductase msrA/msrB